MLTPSGAARSRRLMGRLLNRRGGLIPMSDYAAPPGTLQEVALQALLRLIASRDRSMASQLLAESPSLARQALDVGATRAEESPYYFEQIARFVYAAAHSGCGVRNRHRREACVARRACARTKPTRSRTAPLRGGWDSEVGCVGSRGAICHRRVLDSGRGKPERDGQQRRRALAAGSADAMRCRCSCPAHERG
jgi:hypothetical protein